MPKPPHATISITGHTPDHGDGSIRMGDTVVLDVVPDEAGVVSAIGLRDGQPIIAWNLIRGDEDLVLTPRQDGGPTGSFHVLVELRELVGNNVRTIAETSFDVVG